MQATFDAIRERPVPMTANQELQGVANVCRLSAQLLRHELTAELAAGFEQKGLFAQLAEQGYAFERARLGEADYLRQLKTEFARLFVGPGPHLHPYGSVHHPDDPKKGRMWGDTTVWVRRFAIEHGLGFEGKSYDGIPDHVGHELEIYAHLVEAEVRALAAADERRALLLRNSARLFLTKQLLRWVPSFCAKVQAMAEVPFYRELARLTADVLELERQRLAAHAPASPDDRSLD
jgi:TorA maturation chaperone TorD